jgi:hypothetical protein
MEEDIVEKAKRLLRNDTCFTCKYFYRGPDGLDDPFCDNANSQFGGKFIDFIKDEWCDEWEKR